MDDIYKVFGGVVVGFVLSPLSELIKSKITSVQFRARLLTKVRIHQRVLEKAILATDQTIVLRELFIENPFKNDGPFIIPSLQAPNIESNLEGAYDSLSDFQRERLQILVVQSSHIQELRQKIVKLVDQGKDDLRSLKFDSLIEVRVKEAEQHKDVVRTEKALLVTALHTYNNTCMIIEDTGDASDEKFLLSERIKSFNLKSKDIQDSIIK